MAAIASTFKRATSLALALSFLLAASPGAYGLDRCPYHGHEEGTPGGPLVARHGTPQPGTHAADHAAEDGDGGETCMWRVDCNACVVSTLHAPPVGGILPDDRAEATRGFAGAEAEILGPRHGLFELHLPNAPPF